VELRTRIDDEIRLHGGYKKTKKQKANPEGLANHLILLVAMGETEPAMRGYSVQPTDFINFNISKET